MKHALVKLFPFFQVKSINDNNILDWWQITNIAHESVKCKLLIKSLLRKHWVIDNGRMTHKQKFTLLLLSHNLCREKTILITPCMELCMGLWTQCQNFQKKTRWGCMEIFKTKKSDTVTPKVKTWVSNVLNFLVLLDTSYTPDPNPHLQ